MEGIQNTRPAHSILVVEDDTVSSEVMTLMIARKFPDITLYVANNGKMGVGLFKECISDIVITDINMPEMDGIQMAGEIKSIKAYTKFIVVTGYSDKNYLEKFREIGFSDYILKPVQFGKLFSAIEKCLDEIRLEGQ